MKNVSFLLQGCLIILFFSFVFRYFSSSVYAASYNDPIGQFDNADCNSFFGWTGDKDDPNRSNYVKIIIDGVDWTSFLANIAAEQAVCSAVSGTNCGVCPADQPQCKHRFNITTPPSVKDGSNHTIRARGVNLSGTLGTNKDLFGNPKVINCPAPPPTPTLYPTVAVTGVLKEYNGASCSNNISSNSLSINIVPQSPAGVTPVCTQNPSSGNPKLSYRCTVTFDNQGANPTPAQNLTLNASAPEYQSAYWTSDNSCGGTVNNTIAVDVSAASPITTFNKDIFFNGSSSWIKLRNLSFNSVNALTNPFPLSVTGYDGDDNTNRYFINGLNSEVGGVTSAPSVDTGTAQKSVNDWSAAGYSRQQGFSPSTFFDYVKSRKDYTSPPSFNLSALSSGIYYVTGPVTLSGNAGADAVVIVNGNVTISGDLNTTSGNALAILATGNITAQTPVSNIYSVLVAGGSFDTGTGNGLKIKGNLSAASLTNQRTQTNNSIPSLFIVNDPGAFVKLLPYLSISKYDQTIQ